VFEDFLIRAIFAGLGICFIAGPLGCFVVWQRMAYFGDTLAHSGLLGVVVGVLFGIDVTIGVAVTGVLIALMLIGLQQQKHLPTDTLLGILSHASLASGIVTLSFMETLRLDLMGYLFGDILAVSNTDILWIYLGGLLVLLTLYFIWDRLVAITVHKEMAQAEGIAVLPLRIIFMLLIAVMVALTMKIVGILLITAMLIIPAATARQFASNPEQMALYAVILGILAVATGLGGSLTWDTPAGPSIVVAASLFFALFCLLDFKKFVASRRKPIIK